MSTEKRGWTWFTPFSPFVAPADKSVDDIFNRAPNDATIYPVRTMLMALKPLLVNSWRIIWKDKWIWYCSLLAALFGSLASISIPKNLICLSLPFSFFILLGELAGDIGIVYTSDHIAGAEKVEFAGLWQAGKNSLGRVAAIFLLAVLPSVCLIFTIWYAASSKSAPSAYLSQVILYILGALIAPIISLAYIGVVVDNLGVRKSIRQGFSKFVEQIGVCLAIALGVLFVNGLIILASTLISFLVKTDFNLNALSSFSYKSYLALVRSPVYTISRAIGRFLTHPFFTTLFVLVYLKKAES